MFIDFKISLIKFQENIKLYIYFTDYISVVLYWLIYLSIYLLAP